MIVPVPYVHIGIGLTSILLAIPLIRRKVPMNRLYGVRVPKAFASERNWYEINAYGGRLLLVFGLFVLGFGVLTLGSAPAPTSPWGTGVHGRASARAHSGDRGDPPFCEAIARRLATGYDRQAWKEQLNRQGAKDAKADTHFMQENALRRKG